MTFDMLAAKILPSEIRPLINIPPVIIRGAGSGLMVDPVAFYPDPAFEKTRIRIRPYPKNRIRIRPYPENRTRIRLQPVRKIRIRIRALEKNPDPTCKKTGSGSDL